MTKHPIALRIRLDRLARVEKLFTIALSLYIYIRLFSIPIQPIEMDICFKKEANKKEYMWETLPGTNAAGAARAFSVMQVSA